MRPTRLNITSRRIHCGRPSPRPSSPRPPARRSPHVVQPGETLWSIAAANNLTTRTVAAYNGLSEDSQVVLGSTIQIPTTVEGYASLQQAGLVPADPAPGGRRRRRAGRRTAAAPPPRPRAPRRRRATTRSARATRSAAWPRSSGVSVDAMAAMNGLDPSAPAARSAPCSSCPPARPRRRRPPTPEPAQTVVPQADPEPTADAPRRGRHPVGGRRRRRLRPRSPPRSRGRRAASTTAWSPRPTPAA